MKYLSQDDMDELDKEDICEMCGDDNGWNVIDPYYEDVYQEQILTSLCDKCYQISVDDI